MRFTRGSKGDGPGADGASQNRGSDQVEQVLAAYRKGDRGTRTSIGAVASTLRREGRLAELLELHRGLGISPGLLTTPESAALANTALTVSFLPGLSREDADLAERRLDVLLRYHDLDRKAESLAQFSLAILRLRRGRFADVEPLCNPVLALGDLPPAARETALAAVIVARQALQQPYEDIYGIAVELGRDADLAVIDIWEIASPGYARRVAADLVDLKEYAANPTGPAQPERTDRLLAAYREGDLMARLGAGHIVYMLRAEGRIPELLELHAGFPMPSGPRITVLMHSMALLEDNVACIPGLPAEAYELAASRVRWLIDNYPSEEDYSGVLPDAMRHSLAVARLRQRRFDEVEPLCAPGLANPGLSDSNRADVLATIVIARRALGQPYGELLAQAEALDRDAHLVREALAAIASD